MHLDDFMLPQVGSILKEYVHNLSCLVDASQSESTSTASWDDPRSKKIRTMADRFRILVIGRANAGKTTILQKVCNTEKRPEIFNTQGKKVRNLSEKSRYRANDINEIWILRLNGRYSSLLCRYV